MVKHKVTVEITVIEDHDDSGLVANEILGTIQKIILTRGETVELVQAEVVE